MERKKQRKKSKRLVIIAFLLGIIVFLSVVGETFLHVNDRYGVLGKHLAFPRTIFALIPIQKTIISSEREILLPYGLCPVKRDSAVGFSALINFASWQLDLDKNFTFVEHLNDAYIWKDYRSSALIIVLFYQKGIFTYSSVEVRSLDSI